MSAPGGEHYVALLVDRLSADLGVKVTVLDARVDGVGPHYVSFRDQLGNAVAVRIEDGLVSGAGHCYDRSVDCPSGDALSLPWD